MTNTLLGRQQEPFQGPLSHVPAVGSRNHEHPSPLQLRAGEKIVSLSGIKLFHRPDAKYM